MFSIRITKILNTEKRKDSSGAFMIIDNLEKIIGLTGVVVGIELLAGAIFVLSIIYFRNQYLAGVIGNIFSLSMTIGLITFFLRKE